MEWNELNRFREEFERLYQQPDLSHNFSNLNLYALSEARPNSGSDRLGFLRLLQNFWQRASAFLVEDAADAHQDHLSWWQMHHLRMTVSPSSVPQTTRDWLEQLYRQ